MKISEAFSEYIRFEVVLVGEAARTAESYEETGKRVVRFFGDKEVEKLTEREILSFMENLRRLAPNTARLHIIHLRRVLMRFHAKYGCCLVDPGALVIPKRFKTKINYLIDEDAEMFCEAARILPIGCPPAQAARNYAICRVLFDSGLRVGELVALNRSSIRGRQFTVIGKSKDPRVVFLTPRALDAVEKYLKSRKDRNPALFLSAKTGARISVATVQEIFRNISRRCGISAHPHMARHSFATKLLRNKVDIFYIAQLLGHQSLDTTKQYLHYENPVLKEIYDAAMANSH